jgi:hypothetical protein
MTLTDARASLDEYREVDPVEKHFTTYILRTLEGIGGKACAGDLGNELRPRMEANELARRLNGLVLRGALKQEPENAQPDDPDYAFRTVFSLR